METLISKGFCYPEEKRRNSEKSLKMRKKRRRIINCFFCIFVYNYLVSVDPGTMGTVWKGNQMKPERFIGRSKEKEILEEYFTSHKSEFVAIYGRRRVGKTYLVKKRLIQM